ncbi:MAG: mechanosensitive ion channel [Lysobacterales bacterium]|jgi:small conductance mechanosensitive channel
MESFKEYLSNVDYAALVTDWAVKIIVALLIYFIGKWIAHRVMKLLGRVLEGRRVDATLVKFLSNVGYAILLTVVILAALDQLGVPVTSLVAVLGAAGLAIGLALKDSLGNFASGVMLVGFRPFSKGDFVEVAGIAGKVEEVRIFSTVLVTPDNKQITVPNGLVYNGTITNYTALDTRRVDMVFGVGYDDDLKVARDVLMRICAEHPLVLDDPAPAVFVTELGDSSVNFNVRPWVKTADYWTVWGDLMETGKVELEAAGCSIPFPQRDVHMYATNPLAEILKR